MSELIGLCITMVCMVVINVLFNILSPDGSMKKYINLVISMIFTLLISARILNVDAGAFLREFSSEKHYDSYNEDYSKNYNEILSDKFAFEITSDAEKYIEENYNIRAECETVIDFDIYNNRAEIKEISIWCNTEIRLKKQIADDVAKRYATEVTIR